MDKLEQANLNITTLVDELLYKERDYLSGGYCPINGGKSNYCEDGFCNQCKEDIFGFLDRHGIKWE